MSDINWKDYEVGALWKNATNIGGTIVLDEGTPEERTVKLTLWRNSYKDPNDPKFDPKCNPKSPDFRVYADVPDREDFTRNESQDSEKEPEGEVVPF